MTVYSPNATWANVKAAVAGANIIVWMGHGNGFPNPYSATENTDRVNGWGLNKTTTGGDSETNMAYCGERALLGTLTGADDATRLTYCGGTANDGIAPAPGFVMIYAHACYTPGAGEARPAAAESVARARVANFAYPPLKLGGGAFFATDYGDEAALVSRLLANPALSFGDAFRAGQRIRPGRDPFHAASGSRRPAGLDPADDESVARDRLLVRVRRRPAPLPVRRRS